MKKSGVSVPWRVYALAVFVIGLVATTSSGAANAKGESEETGKDPKGATTIVLEQPIARVHQAAVNALAVAGCKIRKNSPTYLEGKRANKVGLAVGSGGETIKIWLTSDGPSTTTLMVATAKSVFGYVGQRSWNEAIVTEVEKEFTDGGSAQAPVDPVPAQP